MSFTQALSDLNDLVNTKVNRAPGKIDATVTAYLLSSVVNGLANQTADQAISEVS